MKCILAIAFVIWEAVSGIPAFGAESHRPNVLMITVDNLNDYFSILQNYPGIKTPNFGRLAKRSVNFTRAYCAAPLCNPSRVAVTSHADGGEELYDHQNDPRETVNLAKQPDLKSVIERLSASLPEPWVPERRKKVGMGTEAED